MKNLISLLLLFFHSWELLKI